MNITAIRSDRMYREMMNAAPAEKENIYRDKLMKPFEFKWSCVGIPLRAETDGGYDVVSAAAMSGYYAPVQITEERHVEIDQISNEAFWADCENSIRKTLSGFEQRGIELPKQEYVFTVVLSDPFSGRLYQRGILPGRRSGRKRTGSRRQSVACGNGLVRDDYRGII